MSIPAETRQQVRQRAGFACEYCGVTETDAAGTLTLDHFHPQSLEGSDDLDNLLYCCHRCNEHKADYWPRAPDDPALWNPRREPASAHFVELADGTLYATTPTGGFSIRRLHLNRPPLVAHRLRRRQSAESLRLESRLRDSARLLEQLYAQQAAMLEEQRALLQEMRHLHQILLEQQRENG